MTEAAPSLKCIQVGGPGPVDLTLTAQGVGDGQSVVVGLASVALGSLHRHWPAKDPKSGSERLTQRPPEMVPSVSHSQAGETDMHYLS